MLNKVSYEAIHNFSTFLQSQRWTIRDVESGRYPIAVEGAACCNRKLDISVIGGDTGDVFFYRVFRIKLLLIQLIHLDSIFVKFHNATIEEAICWGQKGSDFFSGLFKEGIKMEYEKVWSPYIAIAKKKGIEFVAIVIRVTGGNCQILIKAK
ncbi:MAG: hypothetical protein EOP45_23235 [Sphingobacteriaceae bacterium]|nr:MAG: hypothetical protein EOP45_23235 [Sphingobacteriaceae bacterium]